jgi:hypothetical protein
MHALASFFPRRIIAWLVFAALSVSLLPRQQAAAQSAAPQATQSFSVHLPLVVRGGTPPVGGFPRQPSPLAVAPQLDTAHTVSQAIGPEGGAIEATAADGTRYRLTIPADALAATETITMTPVLQIGRLPLSGGVRGAVRLLPEGLRLFEPAQLAITSARAVPPGAQVVGFAYAGGGAEFGLYPAGASPQALSAQADSMADLIAPLTELKTYGTGAGTPAEIKQQVQQHPPSAPEAQAYQESAGGSVSAGFLDIDYQVLVRDVLRSARTDARVADEAVRLYVDWIDRVKRAGVYDDPTIVGDRTEALTSVLLALDNAQKNSFERCSTQQRPEEGFAMLRWMRYHRKFFPNGAYPDYQSQLGKCLTFELKYTSAIEESTSGYGYRYELNATVPLHAAADMTPSKLRMIGSAPLVYTSVTWLGAQIGCTFTASGTGSTFDVESGENGFTIRPVSRTSPQTKLALTYDPGKPFETVTIACPGAPPSTDTSTAWRNYYNLLHAAEQVGSGFQVVQQKAGAGDVRWVYHQTTTGPGGQSAVEDTTIQILHKPQR